jgi:biotin transport system substrate-specific component
MRVTAVVEDYVRARTIFFKRRHNMAIMNKILLAFGMACVTGLLAQARIGLPWTPVPITGQTFAVLLSGVILGRWWGGISQAIYVVLGVVAVPWFASWSGGYSVLIGPTGGYLIGFILAALFLGHFIDKYIKARSFRSLLVLMVFANFVLIHIPGLIQLALWLQVVKGTLPTLWELLMMGTIPFIIGDLTKIVAAATFATAITPKEDYNYEADVPETNK